TLAHDVEEAGAALPGRKGRSAPQIAHRHEAGEALQHVLGQRVERVVRSEEIAYLEKLYVHTQSRVLRDAGSGNAISFRCGVPHDRPRPRCGARRTANSISGA